MDIKCERQIGIKGDSNGFHNLESRSGRRNWEFGFDFIKSETLMTSCRAVKLVVGYMTEDRRAVQAGDRVRMLIFKL